MIIGFEVHAQIASQFQTVFWLRNGCVWRGAEHAVALVIAGLPGMLACRERVSA